MQIEWRVVDCYGFYTKFMAKICQLSGKRPSTGHSRSHSLRATKRRFLPNVTKKIIIDPLTGKKVKVRISTRAQRTLLKNPGKFAAALKKLTAKQAKRK